MILYAAKGPWNARRRFQPRHFRMLTDAFAAGQVDWTEHLADLPRGGWGLVVHAPGRFSLSKSLAVRHAGGLYAFGALSRQERRALEAKRGVLVLDLDWDPLFPDEEVVAGLLQSIDSFELDPAQVRLVHCNEAARAAFEAQWRRLASREPLRTLEFPTSFALAVAYHQGRRTPDERTVRLQQAHGALHAGSKAKRFASLNGGLRPPRLHLIAWLHHLGLLERGHVSLLGYRKRPWLIRGLGRGGESGPPAEMMRSLAKAPYAEEVADSLEAVWAKLPLTLDLEGPSRDFAYEQMAWESADPALHDDSWFSVVMEPYADRTDMLHVTEKVAKPMLNAQPFLANGSQHALARLRALGFESFAPQFNEDFDEWPWPRERFRLLLDEVRRVATLPEADLRQACIELWPRCEHNYRHFLEGGARDRLSEAFQGEVLDRLL